MKKFLILNIALLTTCIFAGQESDTPPTDMHIAVQAAKTKKVSIGFVTVGAQDSDLQDFMQRLQQDFEWSGQCTVQQSHVAKLVHEFDVKKMFGSDVAVALFVSKTDRTYVWRLYDLASVTMIAGQSKKQEDRTINCLAHCVADAIWPYLFGQKSSFQSKIAYCKQIWRKKHGREKPYKQIWVSDFDGSNAGLFIDAPTVSFAPRWNNDVQSPLLLYSENTMSNVQLVLSNMFGKRKVVCCFDGLNMQPTFSHDGKKVVFCLSKDGTSQLYLSYMDPRTFQRKFDRLTFNEGRNISPCFIDSQRVAFVSDFETNAPQIYILDIVSKSMQRITYGGYCACPNYSPVRNQLVYSKMMGQGMQLFTYDVKTQEHTQITKNLGSKEEGSWSACGNYIVFCYNYGNVSRIAQLNLITNTTRFLTSPDDHCSYPDCSPIYDQYFGILNR